MSTKEEIKVWRGENIGMKGMHCIVISMLY